MRFKGYNRLVLSCHFFSALGKNAGQIVSHNRENKRLLQTNQLFTLLVQHRCWKVTSQLGAISAVTEVMQALHALFLACYISTFSSDSRALGCARWEPRRSSLSSAPQSSSVPPACLPARFGSWDNSFCSPRVFPLSSKTGVSLPSAPR